MAIVIATANQKGEVGKTTTCVNLGIGLARHGKKVLLIDADAQGSLTVSLGYHQPDKLPVTLATIMGKVLSDTPISTQEGILRHAEGADSVLIPVQAQYLSVKGLEQLLQTIVKVRRQINASLSIGGILLTMVDTRTNYAKDIISLLNEIYGRKLNIFDSIIPLSVRASETSAEGKSIYTHDPKGKAALTYEALVKEVLSFEKQCA